MAGSVLELEDMRGEGPVLALDIDGEGLRVAVVRGGAVWMYAGMGVAAGVTQEIAMYRKGAAVQSARWSPQPLHTDPDDILGEYLLAVGKGDGSVTVLCLKRRERGRREEWISFSKAKGHKAAICAMSWQKAILVSSSEDRNIVLYGFDLSAKEPLAVLRTIKTGMEQVIGFCLSANSIFVQDQSGLIRAWALDTRGKQVLEVSFQPAQHSFPIRTSPVLCHHWACFPAIPCTNPESGFSLLLVNTDNFDLCEIPLKQLYPSTQAQYQEFVCAVGTARGLVVASSEGVALLDPLALGRPTYISALPPFLPPICAIAALSATWVVLLGTEAGSVYMIRLIP